LTTARILIVEDDMLIALDLQTTLEDLGYQVTSVVSTGKEGIQEVERSDVDLVLMDVRLAGELDGIETAKLIRSRFYMPIIFLTGATKLDLNRLKGTIESCDYVTKPFNDEQLRTAIEMSLKKRTSQGP
jgi:DNA-binding response OmpR family regulator